MKNDKKLRSISRFLSLVLRHEPHAIGLTLDEAGWVPVQQLLDAVTRAGHTLDLALLRQVVASSDKQRFAISDDGLRIRANQGHSVAVDLGLPTVAPPDRLYHGTATRFRDAILREGLQRRLRHHVHLSTQLDTAAAVGQRYGVLLMLEIDARQMHLDGHLFFRSDNGVWLTDHVPPQYLKEAAQADDPAAPDAHQALP